MGSSAVLMLMMTLWTSSRLRYGWLRAKLSHRQIGDRLQVVGLGATKRRPGAVHCRCA